MTVVVTGAVPLVGQAWLPSFFAVAVCLLTTLPWHWLLPGVAVLALAQAPLALAFPLKDPGRVPKCAVLLRHHDVVADGGGFRARLAGRRGAAA